MIVGRRPREPASGPGCAARRHFGEDHRAGRRRCIELAGLLPKASIIHGDGTSQDILDSEGLEHTDALVTLTGRDEENLVVSMYANQLGVPKIVTKVSRIENTSMFEQMGVGTIVSPKDLCSANIVRYVRAMHNQTGAMLTLHRIAGDRVEAMEFLVDDQVRHCGTPLKDIPLRPNILLACVSRQGKVTIPDGNTCFEPGDTTIVVCADHSAPGAPDERHLCPLTGRRPTMNYKAIFRVVSYALLLEAICMVPGMLLCLLDGEPRVALAYLAAIAVILAVSIPLCRQGKKAPAAFYAQGGLCGHLAGLDRPFHAGLPALCVQRADPLVCGRRV